LEIENWIWNDGVPAEDIDLSGDAFPAAAAFDKIEGHFAIHQSEGPRHRFIRDPLGVNKLFFGLTDAGKIMSSNYLLALREQGIPAGRIESVPSGHCLELNTETRSFSLSKYRMLEYNTAEDPGDLRAEGARIRAALEATFRKLQAGIGSRPLYVTMSGGLDSSTIAALAREFIGPFVGVTFCLEDDPESAESDLHHAEAMARHLGVEHRIVSASSDLLAELLDPVLTRGQDWRDFNVHCGLVNAAMARDLQSQNEDDSTRPVVLTGDAMNELMADYSPVTYRGKEYYSLPRLAAGRLRRFLVSGLDSGDREVGIFAHFGLDTIQPFALLADVYAAVPGAVLNRDEAKQQLVREVMGRAIPEGIYERPKVRAQVATADGVGGTMAALIDRNIEGEHLKRRFGELMGMHAREMDDLIRGGFYRFSKEYPNEF
jgi:asparagine synthetase B (glutamine-hydrolysing)